MQSKQWRPPNWDKIKPEAPPSGRGNIFALGVEMGVDAILEKLKRDYLYRVDLVGAESTTDKFLAKLLGKKGWLVFIEDKK